MWVDRLVFRAHAIRRMFERGVNESQIRDVLENGGIIREYSEDQPYPSRLLLGWTQHRPS